MNSTLFRVRFRLDRPMVKGRVPLSLDGVLSAVRVKQAREEGQADPLVSQHDLPLDRYVSPSGQWCFKASILRPVNPEPAFASMMTSRINTMQSAHDIRSGLLGLRQAAPNPAGGAFKTSFFSVIAQWADWEAYGVGDMDAVRGMLSAVEYLGGRRSLGMGRVREIEVGHARDVPDNIWTTRALPDDFDATARGPMALAIGSLAAPYWDRMQHRPVLWPVDF